MSFLRPELLLLGLPLAWLLWRTRPGFARGTLVLRALAGIMLVAALARPLLRAQAPGRDVVLVVDRSSSMPDESGEAALELVRLLEDSRRAGDRLAIVSFDQTARIEMLPSADGRFAGFAPRAAGQGDGSELCAALETALDLAGGDRPASLFVLTDGEATGRDPLIAARRAYSRGMRIDARWLARPRRTDVAVATLDLPAEVDAGETFQFGAWVRADMPVEVDWTLEKDGAVLARGRRALDAGMNRLTFRDRAGADGGIARYALTLSAFVDPLPENDRALGAARVRGPRSLLVVNAAGQESPLVVALRRADLRVVVAKPQDARLDRLSLAAHRAVVLENVPVEDLREGLDGLRDFVLERGGGLLVSGGQASFGVGGYHLSRIDDLLPVSMEMRQEDRKLSIAMAIAMDRSGSMAAPAGGMTKMDLANFGASAAVELLSPMDSVAVIAVDSEAHVVQALTRVDDVSALASRIRSIQSMGGGIFVRSALLAAGRELERAPQQNRHIILFSDAADSEEQEGCPELIAAMREMAITLSVIALGTESDSDAEFLKRIAALGGGEIYFTQSAEELPRLFAQDTLRVARSSFIEEPTGVRASGGQVGIGEWSLHSFPTIAGYNLTYLRPGALPVAITEDEYAAPVLAFHYRGLGRAAAYCGQIGGTHGAAVVAWSEFDTFIATLGRWLAGQEEPREVFTEVVREGAQALVRVELDPDTPTPADAEELALRLVGPDGQTRERALVRTGARSFEARVPLSAGGITLGAVRMGREREGEAMRSITLPPLTLPYSAEFEPRADDAAGARLVERIARESGGEVGSGASAAFRGDRRGKRPRGIERELTLGALLLLVTEIAVRRLQLLGGLRLPRRRTTTRATPAVPPQPLPPSQPQAAPSAPDSPDEPLRESTVVDALRQARESARRKLR